MESSSAFVTPSSHALAQIQQSQRSYSYHSDYSAMSEETETQLVAEAEALADEAVEKAEEVKAFAEDVLTSPTDEGTMKFVEIQTEETPEVSVVETVDEPVPPDEEPVVESEAVKENGVIPAIDIVASEEVVDESAQEEPQVESVVANDPEETVSSDVFEDAVDTEEISEEPKVAEKTGDTEVTTELPEASEQAISAEGTPEMPDAIEEAFGAEETPEEPEEVEAAAEQAPVMPIDVEPADPSAGKTPVEPVAVASAAPTEEGPVSVADDEASPVVEEAPEPIAAELPDAAGDEVLPQQDDADINAPADESVNDKATPTEAEPSVEPTTMEESTEEASTIVALDSLAIQGSPTDEHISVDPAVSDDGADPHPDIDSAPTDEARLHQIHQSEIVTEEAALQAAQKKLEEEEEERLKQLEIAEIVAKKEAEALARLEAEQRALELAQKELIPMDEAQADGVPLSPSGKVPTLDLVDAEAKAQHQANIDCGCIML